MKLEFINTASEEVLTLTDNQYFHLINVDGQTTASSDISSLVIGGIDGDIINNIQAQPRTITLDLQIKNGVDVETAKRAILAVVKLNRAGTLQWTQDANVLVINGVVESVEMPRWGNGITMQISLHCESPFWEDIDDAVQQINEAINLHYFTDNAEDMLYFPEAGIPFGEYDVSRTQTVYNNGDVATGVSIEIVAYSTVTNPILRNQEGEFFGVGYGTGNKKVTMQAGDVIIITTHKGNKSVKLNGDSIISKVKPQSTWIQLEAGKNIVSINSDDESVENMAFKLQFKQKYI